LQNGQQPVPATGRQQDVQQQQQPADQGQQQAQQGQQQQQQRPDVPAEYQQAHDWRAKIAEAAKPIGGLENVQQALKWSGMLFGLEPTPEGVTPAEHFLGELWQSDRQVYNELLQEIATTHAKNLIPLMEDQILAKNEIPKDRLPEIKEFLKFGRGNVSETKHRDFVTQIGSDCQTIFPKLSQAFQDWIVNQVDEGRMSWELAEEQIREKGSLLAMQDEKAQEKARAEEAKGSEEKARVRQVVTDTVQRYENAFVEAYAREKGVDTEVVRDWVARVASEMDAAASSDPRHPAKLAWDNLNKAAASENPLRIQAAMNQVQRVFEESFNAMLAKRSNGRAAAAPNGQQQQQQPAAPRAPQQQQQQFEPDKPGGAEDFTNVSLSDYLFDRVPVAR
jgi:hypothetical protein